MLLEVVAVVQETVVMVMVEKVAGVWVMETILLEIQMLVEMVLVMVVVLVEEEKVVMQQMDLDTAVEAVGVALLEEPLMEQVVVEMVEVDV